jgi:hypothetical protein
MGCEAQVHEKTNKCGTWAYPLVNGWYLFTLPEHYCTHNCHIKHTKSEQLSDMVQLQHKWISNPSITHTDKVMHALAECVKAIQGMTGKARNPQAVQDLQRIVDATQAQLQANPKPISAPVVVPSIKPTTLPADSSRHKRNHKRQVAQLRNAATPISPTLCIRTQAQVATAAA